MTKPQYAYQSDQQSLLRPFYQRWLWSPALDLIPASISPNTLTLISTACAGLSFLLATVASDSALAMASAACLVFAYFSLDNMDGAHARRIGQSSRLGEFLDHWLDTLNNGFVMLGACLAVGLPHFFALLVLAVGTLAFFSVQLELRYTGVFRMGRLADIEGNTAVSGLYLFLAFSGPEFFLGAPAEGWPDLGILLGCGVMGQALWTLLSGLWRLEEGRSDCLVAVLGVGLLVAWAAVGNASSTALLAAVFFANPVFTSRPILARVLGRSTVASDRLALGCLLLAFAASLLGLVDGVVASGTVAVGFAALATYHALGTLLALNAEETA